MVKDGDKVSVIIEKIGTLTNTFRTKLFDCRGFWFPPWIFFQRFRKQRKHAGLQWSALLRVPMLFYATVQRRCGELVRVAVTDSFDLPSEYLNIGHTIPGVGAVFNVQALGVSNPTIGTSGAGQVSTPADTPQQMQFGLKFQF